MLFVRSRDNGKVRPRVALFLFQEAPDSGRHAVLTAVGVEFPDIGAKYLLRRGSAHEPVCGVRRTTYFILLQDVLGKPFLLELLLKLVPHGLIIVVGTRAIGIP